MLGKSSKTCSPKWWFNGDLLWYRVKHHLKQIPVILATQTMHRKQGKSLNLTINVLLVWVGKKKNKVYIKSRVIPGTPNNGTPFMVSFPYYSHIFRDSNMGVGLGNSMGPAYHKGVPCPWGSLEIPLIGTVDHYNHGNPSGPPPKATHPKK